MKFEHVFENVYQKLVNDEKMATRKSTNIFLLFQINLKLLFFSDEDVKIDWDLSLIFSSIGEVKFDGKIRAMDIYMDTNTICKVDFSFSFRIVEVFYLK